MSNKEKLPKLVEIYRPSNPLDRRQLPLVVDENLTLIMDVRGSGIICDSPLIRGKELEEFTKKWETLSDQELNGALQITKEELMKVLNQNVPCVGCRRSVERLYYQLFKLGHPTLDPLVVKCDGAITIKEEKQATPQVLCTIFHQHSTKLAKLIENQPKRSKKSLRCLLHSLDTQRCRPLTPVWRDVWDCMKAECKKDVCIIEAPALHATLENYLRKHRFCGECRTKVLKAYNLLMEEPEPCKEKGYVAALYAGIKRCLPDKHIHLQMKTDYITKLISRAEPELLGSRRERHAKTLEIAQEEVLTCLGICMYERLHRIYMRMREEECTCQVFAAVAIDTLSRSFETAVERKQGISQLELLYAELAREEQQKQLRREQKKIKRRRKKNNGKQTAMAESELAHTENDTCQAATNNGGCHGNPCCECDSDEDEEEEEEEEEDEEEDEEVVVGMSAENKNNDSDDIWLTAGECKCETERDKKATTAARKGRKRNNGVAVAVIESQHDCGYSSENNNGCCETGSLISTSSGGSTMSSSSSPEGSELACSDACCQHHHGDGFGGGGGVDCFAGYGQHPSLQEMLEGCSEDEDDANWRLTPEEVWEFENSHKHLFEKRQELRELLKKKFIDFCVYGPLQVPRLLVQTKYASSN